MILSNAKPTGRRLFIAAIIGCAVLLVCFKAYQSLDATENAIAIVNNCLNSSYDASGDPKLKKWELGVNSGLFLRLRKTYQGGRREYYSFKLRQFGDMVYLGKASVGLLELKTNADNIIEQTYNDPKGDEDNMIQALSIPVKNMEPERLDSLRNALLFLKGVK